MEIERAKALFLDGVAHHAAHRFDAAEACYRQALALCPERVSLLTNLGAALIAQSRFDEAEPLCRRALELEPGNTDCRAQLTACVQAAASPSLRLAMQERDASARPHDGSAHEALGATWLERREFARAHACFARALQLAPDSPSAALGYAQACDALGRHDDAVAAFLDALEHAPDSTLLAQAAVASLVAHGLPSPVPDPRLDRLLLQGFKTPLASPQLLAPLMLARLRAALPMPDAADDALVAQLARLPALCVLLSHVRVGDIELEALLVRARRHLLAAAVRSQGSAHDAERLDFACALARQCWLNEYCWPRARDEMAALATLQARLNAAKAVHDAPALLAFAAYVPVDALLGADWRQRIGALPAPALDAVASVCAMAEDTQRHAAAVETLTAIEDPVSLRVREQYEAHPYPRWSSLPRYARRSGLAAYVRQRIAGMPAFDLPGTPGGVHSLNAGCGTGQHPIEMALRFDHLQLLAIDLSRASLGYAAAMAERHGQRIRFAQADLLRLPSLGLRFHLIESAGVLHHLGDPEAGLGALAACLHPRGLLRISLYSRAARSGIEACRAWAAERGIGYDDEAIRHFRQEILALPHADPRREPVRWIDFHSTSECRDLLLHVQEAQYDVPEIVAMLQRQGLRFLGLEVPPATLHRFLDETPGAAPDDPQAWHAFEQRHPDAFVGMIVVWAQAS